MKWVLNSSKFQTYLLLPKICNAKYNKVANEPIAATTYVRAAHLSASLAPSCSLGVNILADSNHANARLLASYSTGSVMNENKVPIAKSPKPMIATVIPRPDPMIDIKTTPPIITNIDIRDATLTTGTNLERMVNQL